MIREIKEKEREVKDNIEMKRKEAKKTETKSGEKNKRAKTEGEEAIRSRIGTKRWNYRSQEDSVKWVEGSQMTV